MWMGKCGCSAQAAPEKDHFVEESGFFSKRLSRSGCAEPGHLLRVLLPDPAQQRGGEGPLNTPARQSWGLAGTFPPAGKGTGSRVAWLRQRQSFLSMVLYTVSRHPRKNAAPSGCCRGHPFRSEARSLPSSQQTEKSRFPLGGRRRVHFLFRDPPSLQELRVATGARGVPCDPGVPLPTHLHRPGCG